MYINYIFDSSVTNSQFKNSIEAAAAAAAQFFDSTFSNPITVNIQFGLGEENGNQITNPNALAQSESKSDTFSYSQIEAALQSHAQTLIAQIAVGTLPTTDPVPTSTGDIFDAYYVTRAQEKALGLGGIDPYDTGIDGYTGLNASQNFDVFQPGYSVTSRGAGNTYDAIGVIEHETSEILGRIGLLGNNNDWTALDLFRYSSAGSRQLSPGAGFFSIDGVHMLTPFNDSTTGPDKGGDNADWLYTVAGDSFGDGYNIVPSLISPTDIAVMNVLGYQPNYQVIDLSVTISGQTVSNALVTSGGGAVVESGGVLVEALFSGGLTTYTSGGNVSSVDSSTVPLQVGSGGLASNTALAAGGHAEVYPGGTAINTTVYSGGQIDVDPGGYTTHTVVYGGGTENITGGATFDSSGVVPLAAVAISSYAASGGISIVESYGVTSSATMDSGGLQLVSTGGFAVDTTVLFGGAQVIEDGGVASNTQAYGGALTVSAGGTEVSGSLFAAHETVSGIDIGTTLLTDLVSQSASPEESVGGRARRMWMMWPQV
jgi:autotransporter passenger strand-loop-strand repeat protein